MYGHKYTQEEKEFLQGYILGHTYREIQAAFVKQFGWDITIGQIKGYMANHKINNGLTGRFTKGQQAHNEGVKMSEEVYSKVSGTMFKKGHEPANHKPVGSERIDNKDGYVLIKTKEPRTWRLKHRVIWERHHGSIPKGKCLIFLNGDKTDIRIENLILIDRKVHVRMNQSGLHFDNPDSTRAAVGVAKLMSALGEVKRGKRK